MAGFIFVSLYCLMLSVANVLIKGESGSSSMIVWLASIFALVAFGGWHMIRDRKALFALIKDNWLSVLLFNIIMTFTWLCGYVYGLRYIDATTLLCIDMGATPIFSFLILTPLRDYPKRKYTLLGLFFVILSMALIIKQNLMMGASSSDYMLGSLFAVLAALGTSYMGIFSDKLTEARFSATHVLALRFLLFFFVTSFMVWQEGSYQGVTWRTLLYMAIPAVVSGLLAPFAYQNALHRLGALSVAMVMPSVPIITYFLQVYMGQSVFNYYMFGAVVFCALALLGSRWVAAKYES